MTAPKVIWIEPGMPGYMDEPSATYTNRYIRADAPELLELVDGSKAHVAFMKNTGLGTRHLDGLRAALAAYDAIANKR